MAVCMVLGEGCLHEGAARRDDQGKERGLAFVRTLSPNQTLKADVFGFIPRPGE